MLLKKLITLIFIFALAAVTLYVPLRLQHSLPEQTTSDRQAIIAAQFDNDAFYYLTLAKNYQRLGYTSYDSENKTNGYHFLWQYILNYSFHYKTSPNYQLEFVWWLCIILLTIANILIFLTIKKITNSNFLSFFSVFPGYFYLIFDRLLGGHYGPWAAINGMESSLSIFVFSILLILFVYRVKQNQSSIFLIIISILLSFLFLARLDEFFLTAGLALALLIHSEKKVRFRNLSFITAIPLIILLMYILFNYLNYGLILPVSGIVKSEFYPANIIHLLNSLYTGRSFDFLSAEHLYARVIPLILPLIVVLSLSKVIINSNLLQANKNQRLIIQSLKYYVIVKSLYMLFFVDFWNQGYWYFFIPIIVLNIFLAFWIYILIGEKLNSRTLLFAGIIVLLFLINGYYLREENQIKDKIQSGKYDFKSIADSIEKAIGKSSLIEIDDGIISYASSNHCLSGTGLCLDNEAVSYFKKGNLLDYAYSKNYFYLVSVNYFKHPEFIPDKIKGPQDFINAYIDGKYFRSSGKYTFDNVFADKKTGLVIIKFSKL